MKQLLPIILFVLVVAAVANAQSAGAANHYPSPVCSSTYDTIFPTICQGDTFYIASSAYAQSGIYTDTLTNAHGCDSVVWVHLLVNQRPGAGFVAPQATCLGQPTTIAYVGVFVGTPVFNWNFDGATIQSGTNDGPYVVTWATSGAKTLSLTVTSNGCTSYPDTDRISVVGAIATATFTATGPVCVGQPSTITYTGNAGNGATFDWNFAGGNATPGTGAGPQQVSWVTAGVQTVMLVVNNNGCISGLDTEDVVVNAAPSSTFTAASPVCVGGTSTIIYTGTADNAAVFTWNFAGANIVSGGSGTAGPFVANWSDTGQMNLILSLTDNGCTSPPDTVPVVVNAIPVSYAGPPVSFCTGDSAVIGGAATPGYTYMWLPDVGISNDTGASVTVSLTNPTGNNISQVYTVTTYNKGCVSNDNVIVTVNLCTGIPTIAATNLFTLYPNPAEDYTTLNFDAAYTGATIMVKDITGRRLYQTQLTTSPQQIPTGNLPPGVYLVTVYNNGQVGARLLVKE